MNGANDLPITPVTVAEVHALVGAEIGPSKWHPVTQESVDAFADATGDRQWIHVDVERAALTPLGGTIAHGLYTLSLGPALSYTLLSFDSIAVNGLNYGYERVRFPGPLLVGSKVRMTLTLTGVEQVVGGLQVRTRQTFEGSGSDKPIAVAESLARIILDGAYRIKG